MGGLVSILRLGGPILLRNFEIFEKICTYLVNPKILGGAMAPLAPPLTRPLVLSKAKHCQAVLSKAKHWHAVMSEVPFKTSTPFKILGGAMAPLAPPLTRPLVLSKAKHCQAVLSKA